MTEVIEHKYIPRHYFQPFHARHQRFACIVVHRRAGKTVAVINDMIVRAMRTKKPHWFGAYIAPFFGQAKQIAWSYLKQAVANLPEGAVKVHESRTSISFANGAEIKIFGADNADSLRGLYFDLVVLDEVAQINRRVWTEIIRPALADRKGSVVFMGTPKGKNFFYDCAERARKNRDKWFFLKLDVNDTKIIPETELAEIREDLDEAEFNQEFMVSFDAALIGSYYGKLIADLITRGRIANQDLYKPYERVCAAMDIGFNDACAVWFWQVVEGEVRFIEYMEETGKDADELIQILRSKPYDYETIWLPHDAFHRTFQSKKSVFDSFKEFSLPVKRAPNPDAGNRVFHGIDAVRKFLRKFPVLFSAVHCADGIEALKNYSREYNHKLAQFNDSPKHDRWSHGADAFRYAALSIQWEDVQRSIEQHELRALRKQGSSAAKPVSTINTGYTLNQLLEEHERNLARKRAQGRGRV